ncbi:hypothetical protein B0H14DRAFT_3608440 [Mycena olivaceomarginata]|nr:hypothetical protein B0H14DRAFT_3608440 [Mycena olivaceomarginata]
MTTLDDKARIYIQEWFKTPYSPPLPSTAQDSRIHRVERAHARTTESRYRPYQNSQIASNSRMSGKVGRPSPGVGKLGRPPHTLARGPLPTPSLATPRHSSSRPPMAELNPRVTPTPAAPSSQSTSAKRKGDRLSIDSASLERWFFTGVSSQSTSAKPKGDRLSIDSASLERWFFTGVYADAQSDGTRVG